MATIASSRGSVRGLEGGVESTIQSLIEKRKQLAASPAMLRILEVRVPVYQCIYEQCKLYAYAIPRSA